MFEDFIFRSGDMRRLIITLGKESLGRYAEGGDLTDCIFTDPIDVWMQLNEDRSKVVLQLK